MAIPASEIAAACFEPHGETKGFRMQQTMIRVKDPRVSLKFYTEALGMRLLKRIDFPDHKFTLYFVGYVENASDIPQDEDARTKFCFDQLGTIELTHNWGTENQEGPVYHNGNTDPRGFGHLGILVKDTLATCERLEKMGVPFVIRPGQGKLKGVAFIRDPDGYWVELLSMAMLQH